MRNRIDVEKARKQRDCSHENKRHLWDYISTCGNCGHYRCLDCGDAIDGPVSDYRKVEDFNRMMREPMTI